MNTDSAQTRKKILIADANTNTRLSAQQSLGDEFDVIQAEDGLHVLELVTQHPDLSCVIVDLDLPALDGFKTTTTLKSNFATYHVPIIIIINQLAIDDTLHAVNVGADDYIKKPFDPLELKTRILLNIQRTERDQNSNPLTKLAGNAIINRIIRDRLSQSLAILYVDLDHFKTYNDTYGFNLGDKVLLHTASLLTYVVKTYGNPSNFLGHVGGDDFIIIATPDKAETLAQKICDSFDQGIGAFYTYQDRKQKKIIANDRQGIAREYPLISLSIAIVSNEKRKLTSMPQIAQIAAELKNYAKTKQGGVLGSNYVKDRRDK